MQWLTEEWLLIVDSWVRDHSGAWTAKLCRLMNGLDESKASIIYCGLCEHYVNPRKRARAKLWAGVPTLPGMKPPYQLHRPCSYMQLRRLRYLLKVLEQECCMIIGVPGSKIPDIRQARGWDFGTRWYED